MIALDVVPVPFEINMFTRNKSHNLDNSVNDKLPEHAGRWCSGLRESGMGKQVVEIRAGGVCSATCWSSVWRADSDTSERAAVENRVNVNVCHKTIVTVTRLKMTESFQIFCVCSYGTLRCMTRSLTEGMTFLQHNDCE
jgi:hypothetical protein